MKRACLLKLENLRPVPRIYSGRRELTFDLWPWQHVMVRHTYVQIHFSLFFLSLPHSLSFPLSSPFLSLSFPLSLNKFLKLKKKPIILEHQQYSYCGRKRCRWGYEDEKCSALASEDVIGVASVGTTVTSSQNVNTADPDIPHFCTSTSIAP